MQNLAQFTNQYQVTKTLRFELIPVGETENIKKNGLLEKDSALAASYKKMKKTIDEFHKWFIEDALSNVELIGIRDFYSLYSADYDEKKTKEFKEKFSMPKRLMRSCIFSLSSPAWHIPERSPFTSAKKTGTPISENDSARTFIVTVLPVPVAPAISPWRFAIFGRRQIFLSDFAIQSF